MSGPYRLAHLRYKNDASLPLEELTQAWTDLAGRVLVGLPRGQAEKAARQGAKVLSGLSVEGEKLIAFIVKHAELDAEKAALIQSSACVRLCRMGIFILVS